MIEIHPNYIQKEGRTEFVVLSIEEFQSLREHIEDMEDLLDLRNAKVEEGNAPTVALDQVKRSQD
jgi:PHD/YefM family antitoxin component YafN of YafNO toxin-antitoxin module